MGEKLRVLVADDTPLTLEAIAEACRRRNAEVTTAQDADEAVAVLANGLFHRVLTDLNMRGNSHAGIVVAKFAVEERGMESGHVAVCTAGYRPALARLVPKGVVVVDKMIGLNKFIGGFLAS